MELNLEQLEGKLKEYKGSIQTEIDNVKKSVDGFDGKAKAAVEPLQKDLADVQKTLNSIQEQLKVVQTQHVPGLKDEAAKKGFDFGAFVGGIMRARLGIQDPWKFSGQEKEMCEQAMKVRDASNYASDGTAGGYLVPDEALAPVVDATLAEMPIMGLGPTVIRGLVGSLPIPRKTARSTGYMVGENTAPTRSGITYGLTTLSPHKIGAQTVQSNRLAYQSRGVSDQIIRQDITDAIALKLESQLIDGDGTGYNLKGLVAHTGFTASGVTVSGARFRVKDASSMIAAIEAADELRTGGRYGFLMRPRVKWGLKKERAEMYSGQSANDGVPIIVNAPIMTDEQLQAAIGYKIGSTSLIEFTSATLSPVYFGNWAQLYVGIWRDFWIKASDVAVDSSGNSMMTQDSTLIVAFQEVDAAVIRETAFTKVTGADSTEANWS